MVPVRFVFVLCILSDGVVLRLSCVVYFSTVEKVENSYWTSPEGVNYIGTVPSCSPLVPVRPSSVCFLFPCCFSFICSSTCVSFVVSLAVSPCVSSHAFRCRCPSCRPSCRLGSSRLVVSFGAVSFCCSLVLVSFAVAVLPCVPVPSRFLPWRPVCPSSCSSSCRSVSPVVSSCSSRFCPVISFSLARGLFVFVFIPVFVFAPFHPARRSFLFVNLSRPLCLCRRGAGDASWRAVLVCSSRLISPVSLLLAIHSSRC